MDQNAPIEGTESLRNDLKVAKPVSSKHADLLRPSARYSAAYKGKTGDHEKVKYSLIRDEEYDQFGFYDKPLPCFGCGIGWFSFLLGFAFPLMWYYGTILYFRSNYRKDPRERAGLAASAIAAMAFSVGLVVIIAVLFIRPHKP